MVEEVAYPQCPNCGSRALDIGPSTRTLMAVQTFTDEAGRLHVHNRNTTTTSYRCRKCDFEFEERRSAPSCWCGWPEKREVETVGDS